MVENRILKGMNKINDLNGLVLAGGKSLRMGQDKSSLEYFGKTQRQVAFDLLAKFCAEVWVSAKESQISDWADDLPYLKDEYENYGPLGGILTALNFQKNRAWLIIACDLPFVNEELIQTLISHRNSQKPATAFFQTDNFVEPLCTIWEVQSREMIESFIKKNIFSPQKILQSIDCQLIRLDNSYYLQNINTPEAYQQALQSFQKINQENQNPTID